MNDHRSAGSAKTTPQLHMHANLSLGRRHDPSVKRWIGPSCPFGSGASTAPSDEGIWFKSRLNACSSSDSGIHPCRCVAGGVVVSSVRSDYLGKLLKFRTGQSHCGDTNCRVVHKTYSACPWAQLYAWGDLLYKKVPFRALRKMALSLGCLVAFSMVSLTLAWWSPEKVFREANSHATLCCHASASLQESSCMGQCHMSTGSPQASGKNP